MINFFLQLLLRSSFFLFLLSDETKAQMTIGVAIQNICCSECEGKDIVPNGLFVRPNLFTYVTPKYCSWNKTTTVDSNEQKKQAFEFRFQGSNNISYQANGTDFKGCLLFLATDQLIPSYQAYEFDPNKLPLAHLEEYYLKRLLRLKKISDFFILNKEAIANASRIVVAIKYKEFNGKFFPNEYDFLLCLLTKSNMLRRYKNNNFFDEQKNIEWISYYDENIFLF